MLTEPNEAAAPLPLPSPAAPRKRLPRILTPREEQLLDLQRQVDRLTRREKKLRSRQRRTATTLRKLRARRDYFRSLLVDLQAQEGRP